MLTRGVELGYPKWPDSRLLSDALFDSPTCPPNFDVLLRTKMKKFPWFYKKKKLGGITSGIGHRWFERRDLFVYEIDERLAAGFDDVVLFPPFHTFPQLTATLTGTKTSKLWSPSRLSFAHFSFHRLWILEILTLSFKLFAYLKLNNHPKLCH
jgi:hypothetical protein